MGKLISAISSFHAVIAVSLLGSGNCLVAGEIRLAAPKKASEGSSKLSGFTQRDDQDKRLLVKTKARFCERAFVYAKSFVFVVST